MNQSVSKLIADEEQHLNEYRKLSKIVGSACFDSGLIQDLELEVDSQIFELSIRIRNELNADWLRQGKNFADEGYKEYVAAGMTFSSSLILEYAIANRLDSVTDYRHLTENES